MHFDTVTTRVSTLARRDSMALLCALQFVACGLPAPLALPQDNSLVVALESAPIHLDPRIATDQASG